MTATAIGIIPARYASVRFPGKLLKLILGKSLIQRTYENAIGCKALSKVIVATDDKRIFDHVLSFGGNVVMTSPHWVNGTERVNEAIELSSETADIIVNIQGDEPTLDPNVIFQVIEKLRKDLEAVVATPIAKITDIADLENRSIVKCVKDFKDHALYFSRSCVPFHAKHSDLKNISYYRHIGLYAYRRSFLPTYVQLPAAPLEMAENLEQLKILENGFRIALALVEYSGTDVNEPQDIQKVENYLCRQNLSS